MEEREFFSGGDVYVSLTRFVVFGKTYAMSGITSVKASTIHPSRFLPTVMGVIGAFSMLAGGGGIVFGFVLLGLAAWIWTMQKPEYIVQLSSSSGEVQALKSADHDYVTSVVQALNDCIVARG